ncbi:hypothetical protein KKD52_01175 [Myxococcota bacterium]|nr:hypothetical protein [Myxococcota bacterium]MBU1409909.1 hypothetical protein [Myxococcota bacterium]MBU1508942.1 hypothetical protein [Myxococcota bacterium]
MKVKKFYTPVQKRIIGRRWGSNAVYRQVQEVLMLWRLFLATFTEYGLGAEELAAFEGDVTRHVGLLSGRPGAVAAKMCTLAEREETIHAAWTWVSMVTSALGVAGRSDADLMVQLNAARPTDDDDLLWAVASLENLLSTRAPVLAASVPVRKRLDEAAPLRARLEVIFGSADEAKRQTVQDTAEIDELDGHLYLVMRDFYDAGRAAVRAGLIDRPLSTFRFTYLAHSPSRRPAPAPEA